MASVFDIQMFWFEGLVDQFENQISSALLMSEVFFFKWFKVDSVLNNSFLTLIFYLLYNNVFMV